VGMMPTYPTLSGGVRCCGLVATGRHAAKTDFFGSSVSRANQVQIVLITRTQRQAVSCLWRKRTRRMPPWCVFETNDTIILSNLRIN